MFFVQRKYYADAMLEPLSQFADRMQQTHKLNNEQKGYSLYSTVGIELDKYSTKEIVQYVAKELKAELWLRTICEEQIIGAVINELKYRRI